MRKKSASYELVIHILVPFKIQWSPSFFARVCRANASEPDAGSERQNEPSYPGMSSLALNWTMQEKVAY